MMLMLALLGIIAIMVFMIRKARVESSWSPESAFLFVTRKRDVTLSLKALERAAEFGDQEAEALASTGTTTYIQDGKEISELGLKRGEAHVVIDALTNLIPTLDRHPLRRRRATHLIGELVAQSNTKLVNLK